MVLAFNLVNVFCDEDCPNTLLLTVNHSSICLSFGPITWVKRSASLVSMTRVSIRVPIWEAWSCQCSWQEASLLRLTVPRLAAKKLTLLFKKPKTKVFARQFTFFKTITTIINLAWRILRSSLHYVVLSPKEEEIKYDRESIVPHRKCNALCRTKRNAPRRPKLQNHRQSIHRLPTRRRMISWQWM